jgi:hypothetical protein
MSEGRILLITKEYYLSKFYNNTRDFARGKLQGPTRAILRYDVRPPKSLLHLEYEYFYSTNKYVNTHTSLQFYITDHGVNKPPTR